MYDTKYYLVTPIVKKNLLLNEGYTSYWKSYRRKKLKRPCFFSNLFMKWVFEKWRKYFQDGILSFLWVPVMWPQMKKNQLRFEILILENFFFRHYILTKFSCNSFNFLQYIIMNKSAQKIIETLMRDLFWVPIM